jgi:DNA-binding MarR family transcriptional regulator
MTGTNEDSGNARPGRDSRRATTAIDGDITRFLVERGVDLSVHGAVFQTIRAAAMLVNALEEFALRPLGLSHAGYRILVELAAMGPREPRQLAAFMLVSRPAIVRSIDTLSRRGYVERIRSTADRRLVTVQITETGTQIVEKAVLAWHEGQRRATAGLSADEMHTLGALAGRIGDEALQMRGENTESVDEN